MLSSQPSNLDDGVNENEIFDTKLKYIIYLFAITNDYDIPFIAGVENYQKRCESGQHTSI